LLLVVRQRPEVIPDDSVLPLELVEHKLGARVRCSADFEHQLA
jgi:hypothetical protein